MEIWNTASGQCQLCVGPATYLPPCSEWDSRDVLANGSMSSNTSGEGEIRKSIVEADLVDCMIALPNQRFYNTMIPACLFQDWVKRATAFETVPLIKPPALQAVSDYSTAC